MKKKGFTLVELLSVIVVLAIIAIIAVPTILGVIEKAKKGAAKASALAYIDAVEKYMILHEMDSTKYPYSLIEGNTYYVIPNSEIAIVKENKSIIPVVYAEELPNPSEDIYLIDFIKVKGEAPEDGYVVIGEKNTISRAVFAVNKYEISCENSDKCEVTGTYDSNNITDPVEYKETLLNGAYPKLSGDLIPVTIENDGVVKKANINSKWYSYEEKKWANAVILVDKTVTYEDNEVIPETNIESYFVWIPRYKYKLFDLGNYNSYISGKPTTSSNAKKIEIIFGTDTTSDTEGECKTPLVSGESGTCEVGDYMTHPAFITMNTSGLWVGKFETGYKGATTTSSAEITSSDSSKIIVKPNSYSWRNNTVSNMFTAAYNYNRNLDSHMMKNTEWGAVAYLSHSKYGINQEVNINNNSSYLTGYSAKEGTDQSSYPGISGIDESVTLAYNTETGYKASTTGNITGVYDMSGGAHEYMVAYRSGTLGSSGFTATSISNYDSKYFDVYSSKSTLTSYNNRILGDATGEMGAFYYYKENDGYSHYHNNWYADYSYFVDSSNSWFGRGSFFNNGVIAGQLNFLRYPGGAHGGITSRLVLIG